MSTQILATNYTGLLCLDAQLCTAHGSWPVELAGPKSNLCSPSLVTEVLPSLPKGACFCGKSTGMANSLLKSQNSKAKTEWQDVAKVMIYKKALQSTSWWASLEIDFKNINHKTMNKYNQYKKDQVSKFRDPWVKSKQGHSPIRFRDLFEQSVA